MDGQSHEFSNQELLQAWKNGDDAAADLIFHRYQHRLMALVRLRLSRKLARRIDPEDIVLSAYRSFFTAVKRGTCATPCGDELWPLLTTMALRKLARQARWHTAWRRSMDREQHGDSALLASIATHEPMTEHAAVLADEVERLLSQLDQRSREILVCTLQGHDAASIADRLGIHERTVRRVLERVRDLLPSDQGVSNSIQGVRLKMNQWERREPQMTVTETVHYHDYRLEKYVGAGAFSKVYRASEYATNQTVAIKFLRKDCWYDSRAAEALVRECEILARLRHPNILALRGWGSTPGGAIFLVTDFIDGMNLEQWRRETQPSIQDVIRVALKVVAAIAAAHAAKIVHCDVKPANVLLSNDGRVVLCDFGMSRHLTDPEDVPHGGTAGFLAPEQISDSFGPVTLVTDIYGVGGMVYALITGHPPMTGVDFPEILANVISLQPPKRLITSEDAISAALEPVIMRCLEKLPERRFASIAELSVALTNVMNQ